jgi:hypothetical protein
METLNTVSASGGTRRSKSESPGVIVTHGAPGKQFWTWVAAVDGAAIARTARTNSQRMLSRTILEAARTVWFPRRCREPHCHVPCRSIAVSHP